MGDFAEKITNQIEKSIIDKKVKEITSKAIYSTATKILKKYNTGVYLSYVSHFKASKVKMKI